MVIVIYLYNKELCPSVCTYVTISVPPICLSLGDKHFSHTRERGTNIFHTQGGTNILALTGGTNIFALRGGGQTIFVEGYDDDDVDEEVDVSEASKLSVGARILRGP